MKKIIVLFTVIFSGLINIGYLMSMEVIDIIGPSLPGELKIDLPESKMVKPLEKIAGHKVEISENEAKKSIQQVDLLAEHIESEKEKQNVKAFLGEFRELRKEIKELKNNPQKIQSKVLSFSEKAFKLLSNLTKPFALLCVTTVICVLVGRNLLISADFFKLLKEIPEWFPKFSNSFERLVREFAQAIKTSIDSGGENTKKVIKEVLGGTKQIVKKGGEQLVNMQMLVTIASVAPMAIVALVKLAPLVISVVPVIWASPITVPAILAAIGVWYYYPDLCNMITGPTEYYI